MDVKAYVIKREGSRNRVSVVYPLYLTKVFKNKVEKYIWEWKTCHGRHILGLKNPEGIFLKRNLLRYEFDDGIRRWYCIFKDEDLQ